MKAVAKETAKAKKEGASDSQTAMAVVDAVVKETAKTNPEAAKQIVAEVQNTVDGNGQAICQPGQDEVFDNCVKPQQKSDEDEDDSNSIAQTDSQSDTREYGSAAVDLVNDVTSKLEKTVQESQ